MLYLSCHLEMYGTTGSLIVVRILCTALLMALRALDQSVAGTMIVTVNLADGGGSVGSVGRVIMAVNIEIRNAAFCSDLLFLGLCTLLEY